jgi:hypothetical protein
MISINQLKITPEPSFGGSYPEQYDVLLDNKTVGYMRLRHGRFTVECPDVGGKLVYEAYPKGYGEFEDEERSYFLDIALSMVTDFLNETNLK